MMADHAPREHFIPLRHSDLVDLLCNDNDLKPDDREHFRYFCRLVTAIYRYEFYQRLTELKTAYAPFDPDSDTKLLERISADEEQRRLNDLFCDFGWLMERATFRAGTLNHHSRRKAPGASAWRWTLAPLNG
jgi:hypothetical protein